MWVCVFMDMVVEIQVWSGAEGEKSDCRVLRGRALVTWTLCKCIVHQHRTILSCLSVMRHVGAENTMCSCLARQVTFQRTGIMGNISRSSPGWPQGVGKQSAQPAPCQLPTAVCIPQAVNGRSVHLADSFNLKPWFGFAAFFDLLYARRKG